jgi:hypothetical protein
LEIIILTIELYDLFCDKRNIFVVLVNRQFRKCVSAAGDTRINFVMKGNP